MAYLNKTRKSRVTAQDKLGFCLRERLWMRDPLNKKKILIVDDQETNLDFLEEHFSKKVGFIVERAKDGVDALKKLDNFYPDIILLDNIMPHMTGHELVRILKSDRKYSKIPIIIFSANDNTVEKASCLNLGIEEYIVKPINLSSLRERIKAVLSREA